MNLVVIICVNFIVTIGLLTLFLFLLHCEGGHSCGLSIDAIVCIFVDEAVGIIFLSWTRYNEVLNLQSCIMTMCKLDVGSSETGGESWKKVGGICKSQPCNYHKMNERFNLHL